MNTEVECIKFQVTTKPLTINTVLKIKKRGLFKC